MNIEKLKQEFAGKTNHEAYELAFIKRMLRPNPTEPGTFLGNTQRQEFIPLLKCLFEKLPRFPQVLDIGAGGGEIVDAALKHLHEATINLVEPNPVLLAKYQECLRCSSSLREGVSYCGPFQDYYDSSDVQMPAFEKPQDLILAIHMLYHFTDPRSEQIDPDNDLESAVAKMFSFLAPGGFLFIVFANQLVSTTGRAGRYYFSETGRVDVADRLLEIARSRERLLGQGEISKILNERFGPGCTSVESTVTPSCFYGDNVEDIVAMCITAEIGEINEQPFDLRKLDLCGSFVQKHSADIELVIESRDVPQRGMVRSNQPQIVCVIQRHH
ncbi:MAG TPA: class I SAM-dependent methyltransferase [Oculatellaceae cyanobacterium]